MKKIIFIITSLHAGGAERVASMLINSLAEEKNITVDLILLDQNKIFYDINERISTKTFPLYLISIGIMRLPMLLLQSLWVHLLIKKYNKTGKEITIVSFLHRANIVSIIASLASNKKAIISERSLFSLSYSGIKKKIMKLLLETLYSKSKKIIAVSNSVKKELINELKVESEKIITINNPSFYEIKNTNKYKIQNEINLLFVGRIVPSKRIDILIKLIKKLNTNEKKFILNIAGDGPHIGELKRLTDDLKIDKNIKFLGNVKDLSPLYLSADLFVFASTYESFGNVLIEAISFGLPVVLSYCDDGRLDIFQDAKSGGIFFEKDNIDSLCNAVIEATEESQWKIHSANAIKNAARFSKNEIINKYKEEILE